jgi:Flp pilus assembly protein TadD
MELDFRSGYARTWHLRGIAHFRLGRLEDSLTDLSRAIAMNAGEPSYWRDRGLVHLMSGQEDKAAADFTRCLSIFSHAIDVEPENWSTWNRRGEAYFRIRRWPESEADFSRAIELEPDNPLPWRNRASCHCEQGRWNKAVTDLTMVITLDQKGYQPWHELALCRLAEEDVAGYQEACCSMIEQFRHTDDSLTARSVAWSCVLAPRAVGQYAEVLLLGKTALLQSSEDPHAHTCLGAVLFRAGELEEAIKHLTKANALMGASPDSVRFSPAYTWSFLAMACHARGDAQEASRWLAKAMAWTEQVLAKQESGMAELSWTRRLTLQILRKEAEALIRGPVENKEIPTDAE